MNVVDPATLAHLAALISSRARAAILTALVSDQRARSAGELAVVSDSSVAGVSRDLKQLVNGGLLAVTTKGRRRYYSLTGQHVCNMLQAMHAFLASPESQNVTVPIDSHAFLFCRTCYNHLAGQVAVKLVEAMEKLDLIRRSSTLLRYELTLKGRIWLWDLGIDLRNMHPHQRSLAHPCSDGTEHTYHIGGIVGNRLFNRFLELRWIERSPGSRIVTLTGFGRSELARYFGITLTVSLPPPPSGRGLICT